MGNSGGKNKTHPLSEQERRGQAMMRMSPGSVESDMFPHPDPHHRYEYEMDQRYDYDSGVGLP